MDNSWMSDALGRLDQTPSNKRLVRPLCVLALRVKYPRIALVDSWII
jgi:hypothetical protein